MTTLHSANFETKLFTFLHLEWDKHILDMYMYITVLDFIRCVVSTHYCVCVHLLRVLSISSRAFCSLFFVLSTFFVSSCRGGGREGGREAERERGREEVREGGREEGREGGREEGREGGRK